MRYFVSFSYDGRGFHGWQRQPNGVSVQQVMEEAFSLILSEPVELTAAGRTDAGVHARLMVAHFDLTSRPRLTTDELARLTARLNSYLDRRIAIRSITPVRNEAHARFDATSRTYHYHVVDHKDPFSVGMAVRVQKGLDFELMNTAASLLLKTDDFASFCKLHTDVKTTLCRVTQAEWQKTDDDGHYVFVITADRFLRNMVRAVVGTLLEVGRHKMKVEQFADVLSRKHRTAAGESAPSDGLFLVDITYPKEIYDC